LEDCCKEDSSNRIDNIENYSEIDEIENKGPGDTVSEGPVVGGLENECVGYVPVVPDRYIHALILMYMNFCVYCIYACESGFINIVLTYSSINFYMFRGGDICSGDNPDTEKAFKAGFDAINAMKNNKKGTRNIFKLSFILYLY
jgi:hypothetical protein